MPNELPPLGKTRVFRIKGMKQYSGLCYTPNGPILLDEKLRGKELLETMIHEGLHDQYPVASEETINDSAKELTDWLWRCGVRIPKLRQRPL